VIGPDGKVRSIGNKGDDWRSGVKELRKVLRGFEDKGGFEFVRDIKIHKLIPQPMRAPKNNGLRFNSQADPLFDSMGPAHISHPAEYKAILNDLEANNVSIKYGNGSIAFSPNTAGGPLGNEILLPNEFSISALRHEYGHFLDHQALGSPRYIEYFKKPELILSTERRQYLGEIRTAREVGDRSARRTLIENYLNEKNYIIDRYYQRPYGGKVDTTTVGGN
tara:strand:+ start:177 stop:839 length:663 start_codon:yes stop_codon:yes gene_type:complete